MNISYPVKSKELFSWALYDWASSAYFTVIQSFIFSSYFTASVAENPVSGSAQWGNTIGFTGVLLAISAPILGCIADEGGQRKRWTLLFTLVCVISTALLWFVKPDISYVSLALILTVIGTFSSEVSFVFYNSMLPSLTTPKSIGLWSGWAWSLGYFGGLTCLFLCFLLFIYPEASPFNLDLSKLEHIRATFVFTALWYLVFSLPLFFVTRETAPEGKRIFIAVKEGFSTLKSTLLNLKEYKNIVIFLIAHMIYIDALATLFAFSGIFATGIFQMSTTQVALLGIFLNIGAGIGSFIFAFLDDHLGSKKVIMICLLGLILSTFSLYFIDQQHIFWIAAVIVSLFIGPVQASSRAFMAKISPPEKISQFFGMFVLSGKATSFIGPFLIAYIIHVTGSQRPGILVLPILFFIGASIMVGVKK